ncbi:Sterol O-acyltransferase 1 [Hypsibius exemplaris]|uniref:O-acyltransferase n=1 Tax=Hypsibius exemplaris TaxID=2072580 RepID=A0A1W0WSN1_HYPEX|nr:Sterol O-acyltransferase 1 [Hypsibius exemplaris]
MDEKDKEQPSDEDTGRTTDHSSTDLVGTCSVDRITSSSPETDVNSSSLPSNKSKGHHRRTSSSVVDDLYHEILRGKAQALKQKHDDQMEQLAALSAMFDDFIEQAGNKSASLQHLRSMAAYSGGTHTAARDREPDGNGGKQLLSKVFHPRPSLLTELFEIPHIQTIHYIFIAVLLVFSLSTGVNDIMYHGTIGVDFRTFQYTFGKLPLVMAIWVCMQVSTLLAVYSGLLYWSKVRNNSHTADYLDYFCLAIYLAYQAVFIAIPAYYIAHLDLPPASATIVVVEQVRFIMKSHAFVREKIPVVIQSTSTKAAKCGEDVDPPLDFGRYIYFQFIPTLIYRDDYPRNKKIRWNFVLSNFANVAGAVMYAYYIFIRFCIPVFRNFNHIHVNPKTFVSSMFSCILPGALLFVMVFFALLHCWMNAFAEMLRFADRMFYRDWWNSTNFSNYYRTWNVIVHDWLYSYIYKDLYTFWGAKNRHTAMMVTFILSALFHEYIFCCMFRFFYPVLFVMFAGMGVCLIFVTQQKSSPPWNVLLWTSLLLGIGMLMCLYTMEYYARFNCPPSANEILLDFVIPRSWTCYVVDDSSNVSSLP